LTLVILVNCGNGSSHPADVGHARGPWEIISALETAGLDCQDVDVVDETEGPPLTPPFKRGTCRVDDVRLSVHVFEDAFDSNAVLEYGELQLCQFEGYEFRSFVADANWQVNSDGEPPSGTLERVADALGGDVRKQECPPPVVPADGLFVLSTDELAMIMSARGLSCADLVDEHFSPPRRRYFPPSAASACTIDGEGIRLAAYNTFLEAALAKERFVKKSMCPVLTTTEEKLPYLVSDGGTWLIEAPSEDVADRIAGATGADVTRVQCERIQ
jgi:hypothetical protein